MRRQGARLIPIDEIGADDLVRVPANRDVLVKITSHRNMKLFRFLWALASKVADACDHLHDREDAMDELKIRVRHVKYITNPVTGEVRIVPKSLTKLDGPGLSRLADRMVYVICRDIVPGLSQETLRSEIMAMIEGPANSNSSQPMVSPDDAETDTPASEQSPKPTDAGDHIQESSGGSPATDGGKQVDAEQDKIGVGLPAGWQVIYARVLTEVSKTPKSIKHRRSDALKSISGTPSEDDLAEMAAMDELVKRRNTGGLTPDEFKAQLREILPAGVEI